MPGLRLTDGGLETSLIFHQGLDLPLFAAFPLVGDDVGRAALLAYWQPYLAIARDLGAGFVVDTPTWRANPEWAGRLGYDAESLRVANQAAASFALEVAAQFDDALVNGVVGPRGDGYVVGDVLAVDEAATYHRPQIQALWDGGVDQVSAVTFTYPDEAIGFVLAAADSGVPALVSFTVETDGRLPSGHSLQEAVELVDDQTGAWAEGFMVNCAHPSHFEDALGDGPWLERVVGIRANASTMSHDELDAAEALDDGDPVDLAERCRSLLGRLPSLELLGGCCGTDHRHIRAIGEAWRAS